MKVTFVSCRWQYRLLICLWLFSMSNALQAEDSAALLEQARQCGQESSRLDRLGCYDNLFLDEQRAPTDSAELPPLWHSVISQEEKRSADDFGLIVSAEGDQVLMTVPARGTTPPRPVLVLACEKLITRFQVHLPNALDTPRVSLRVVADGRDVSQQWRVRDDGHVVSGGRGLPAIETLRQLLSANELVLSSDAAALDGLRFDVSGLRQQIQPLRSACRW
ncbi:type VI secretion system-associated protein VasI [Vreelandella boliviensis]|uniref:type VI secretion system-associated protein VasI n=1 Tax=Vreelandella boliviensis TaxID=223527 RepID=UPI001B8AB9F0|nr:type VI secretion system-associated protein VasI [Halomonas boliviensis]MBS3667279.1 type VI secretion system-associated protein TagO [Halomonas boliviensis]